MMDDSINFEKNFDPDCQGKLFKNDIEYDCQGLSFSDTLSSVNSK